MAHVTLPAQHHEDDFELAALLVQELELEELHVFWLDPDGAARTVDAQDPAPEEEPRPLSGLRAIGGLLERAGGRLAGRLGR